ncbi:MAG: hypothetical protein KKB20_10390 [Proteobacteria bacterium]|nr:hypothetical protein [Pseudomonadota bacterium]
MAASKKAKKQEETLKELEHLSRKVGLRVAYGDMRFAGLRLRSGHCLFKGERWLVLDRKQSFEDKLDLFFEALGQFDLHDQELSPELKRMMGLPADPPEDLESSAGREGVNG